MTDTLQAGLQPVSDCAAVGNKLGGSGWVDRNKMLCVLSHDIRPEAVEHGRAAFAGAVFTGGLDHQTGLRLSSFPPGIASQAAWSSPGVNVSSSGSKSAACSSL